MRCAATKAFTGFVLALIASLTGTAPADAKTECGKASWYEFTSTTASGEKADPKSFTAAHPSLPFGTKVKVKNLGNGRAVVVRINDRGPNTGSRIIDLSRAAAAAIRMVDAGTARVRVVPADETDTTDACR